MDKDRMELYLVTSAEPSTLYKNLIMFLLSVHPSIMYKDYFQPPALFHLPFYSALFSDDDFTSYLKKKRKEKKMLYPSRFSREPEPVKYM